MGTKLSEDLNLTCAFIAKHDPDVLEQLKGSPLEFVASINKGSELDQAMVAELEKLVKENPPMKTWRVLEAVRAVKGIDFSNEPADVEEVEKSTEPALAQAADEDLSFDGFNENEFGAMLDDLATDESAAEANEHEEPDVVAEPDHQPEETADGEESEAVETGPGSKRWLTETSPVDTEPEELDQEPEPEMDTEPEIDEPDEEPEVEELEEAAAEAEVLPAEQPVVTEALEAIEPELPKGSRGRQIVAVLGALIGVMLVIVVGIPVMLASRSGYQIDQVFDLLHIYGETPMVQHIVSPYNGCERDAAFVVAGENLVCLMLENTDIMTDVDLVGVDAAMVERTDGDVFCEGGGQQMVVCLNREEVQPTALPTAIPQPTQPPAPTAPGALTSINSFEQLGATVLAPIVSLVVEFRSASAWMFLLFLLSFLAAERYLAKELKDWVLVLLVVAIEGYLMAQPMNLYLINEPTFALDLRTVLLAAGMIVMLIVSLTGKRDFSPLSVGTFVLGLTTALTWGLADERGVWASLILLVVGVILQLLVLLVTQTKKGQRRSMSVSVIRIPVVFVAVWGVIIVFLSILLALDPASMLADYGLQLAALAALLMSLFIMQRDRLAKQAKKLFSRESKGDRKQPRSKKRSKKDESEESEPGLVTKMATRTMEMAALTFQPVPLGNVLDGLMMQLMIISLIVNLVFGLIELT